MGCQHADAIYGKTFAFFGSGLDVLGCDWLSSKMEMIFLFRTRDSSFLQNNVYHHRQTR